MNIKEPIFTFEKKENVKSILVLGKETDSTPKISVIMPVYNHPDFFEKSLLSVINQEGNISYEIVIVDNQHPSFQKENQEIVKKYLKDNIRYYVNSENIGGVGSENRGILLSKGKYITFCHDDDLLYEDALSNLLKYRKKIGQLGSALFGDMDIIDENDDFAYRKGEFDSFFLKNKDYYKISRFDFFYKNYTNGCGSLYLRKNLIEAGGFRDEFIPCPDYALNAVYTIKFGAYALRCKTLKYRVSSQSDTSSAFRYLVDGNKKIIREVVDDGSFLSMINRPFVKAHIRVTNYHLYTKWSAEKPGKIGILFYRIINRIQIIFFLWIKSLR